MATLALGLAGQALGNALLPAGVTLFGQTLTGAAIGGAIGAYAGLQADALLSGSARVEGARLASLQVQSSTAGAPIPRVWGTARLAGQVIWAARLTERSEQSGGGKGGARVTDYSYTASFAVGLCEGEIGGIGRVWADGKPLVTDGVTMRVYRGDETQMPDPLIEAIEGTGAAPAYRGLAYIVFEDLPLEAFGNRVPQLSIEVMRSAVDDDDGALARTVEAVCLIPGSGEWALSPTPVLRDLGRGAWAAENVNNLGGRPDFEVALDQMQAQLPNVKRVALVVCWFGDDLRAGECRIRPGVEVAVKRNHPEDWSVAGAAREDAYVVSASDGRPNYGGTPSDATVVAAIQALKARGLEVMFYPFVLMDVVPGNGRPDPYGGAEQAVFPWRGRITCHPAAGQVGSVDKIAAAGSQVSAFFTGDWGLRHMVLHYAGLVAEAGGVDAFLVGSEFRGLTTVRSGASTYPAVAALKTLAADVRAVVGPDCRISYAADWTEWFGHDAADGSGDFHFHLDPLWSDANIDFIGIDNYAPLSDWRDGVGHLDYAASPSRSVYDRAYLQAGVEGGERFDWYYASDADRLDQTRTPITDGAYGKPWMFRAKDVHGWWEHAHHDRPGGVEAVGTTGWMPQSKPVRFTELGCPAVDKGANQPNVFFDPKSSESALPFFSDGGRDDAMQRAALEAVIGYWKMPAHNPVSSVYGAPMIEAGHAHVWAWDTRPYPDWPLRTDVWGDGPLWRVGHWLNGRAGLSPLAALVNEICAYCGVDDVDVTGLSGACGGYVIERVMSGREALSALMDAYAFDVADSNGTLRFFHRGSGVATVLEAAELAEPEEGESVAVRFTRGETAALPAVAKVTYVDALADYQVAAVEARLNAAPAAKLVQLQLPLALSRIEAEAIAARVLHEAWAARVSARFAAGPASLALEAGDLVQVPDGAGTWTGRLTQASENGRLLLEAGPFVPQLYHPADGTPEGRTGLPPPVFGPATVAVLGLPPIALSQASEGPYVAVFVEPWPGAVSVWRGSSEEGPFASVARVTRRAVLGETLSVLDAAAPNIWHRDATLDVLVYGGGLRSATERQVLDGANCAAVETAPGIWEVIQFAGAELVAADTYRLSGLLHGQAGSEGAMASSLAAGARFVLLDAAVVPLGISPDEAGTTLHLRVGPASQVLDDPAVVALALGYEALGRRPFAPCQVAGRREVSGDVTVGWVRRARDDLGTWSELEVALGEEAERYRLEVLDGAVVKRVIEVSASPATYTAAMQSADWGGTAPSPLVVRVTQISPRYGAGWPREAALDL